MALSSWHKSPEFQELAEAFQENYARTPSRQIKKEAKANLTRLLVRIRDGMQADGVVSRLEYQGSSYEGTNVMSSPLEFDCVLILSGGESLRQHTDGCTGGYARLRADSRSYSTGLLARGILNGNFVSRTSATAEFKKALQKAIDALGLSGKVRLGDPNVSVKMTVFKPGTRDLWYIVDMVPGFEVRSGQGNPVKFVAQRFNREDTIWYRSNAMEEKEKLRSIDRGLGCRKMCIRMFKVIRDVDPILRNLGSYPIKNTMLLMQPENLCWGREHLGERFVDLLTRVEQYLRSQHMPKHDQPNVNVLQGYQNTGEMARRINQLLHDKREMQVLLRRRFY